MEGISEEYSKFLDESGKHLNFQSLVAYINLPENLSDKEKQFISSHLAECQQCNNAFNSVFDEDLNLNEKKNIIILFRQHEVSTDEAAIIQSENDLVEMEITRINETDFNLRFLTLPSGLSKQKAALKVDSEYILRILSLDTDTMYIIHSDIDIMNLGSFELVSLAAPLIIPQAHKPGEPARGSKYYWFAASIILIFAATVLLYYATRTEERIPGKDEPDQVMVNPAPARESVDIPDTITHTVASQDQRDVETPQNPLEEMDRFAVDTTLEKYISRNKGDKSQVEIISPAAGAQVRMPVRFEWMTAHKNRTMRFVILTNQNNPVYERLINGRELTLDTKLDPGLYYWKLGSSDSILTMGKFYIR